MNETERAVERKVQMFIGACVVVGLIFVSAVIWIWAPAFRRGGELELNEAGDALGPFSSLFSALALVATLITLKVQRAELRLQQQELRETREEMKAQTALFEQQGLTASEQVRAAKEATNVQQVAIQIELQKVQTEHLKAALQFYDDAWSVLERLAWLQGGTILRQERMPLLAQIFLPGVPAGLDDNITRPCYDAYWSLFDARLAALRCVQGALADEHVPTANEAATDKLVELRRVLDGAWLAIWGPEKKGPDDE